MKDTILTILTVLGILFVMGVVISGQHITHVEDQKKSQQVKDYIDNCLKEGRRVEQIGNGIFTKSYIVCNPK